MTDVDIVVVGAGIMGSATARALARGGREVLLLERFHVGHTRGSSHGSARVFRLSYHDPRYVRMAREAMDLWRELEDETGEGILTVTGGLDLGKALDEHAEALEAGGVGFELVDGAEAGRRFPLLSLADDEWVLVQPDAGTLAADRAWEAFVRSAREAGAEVREETAVDRLAVGDGGVDVTAGEDRWRARVAVLTAGAWTRRLLWGIGEDIPTTPTRETVAFYRLPEGAVPPVVVDWGSPPMYSLFSFDQGLKASEHGGGPVTDPERDGTVGDESVHQVSAWVRDRFPEAEPEAHHAETCIYTNTPDEGFILDRRGPLVIGSPCSGHGFKFAPWIGRRLAELASAPG